MKKPVIATSRALAPQQVGTAYEERIFFGAQGLGRQMNPVIGASYVAPTSIAAGSEAASHVAQPQCGFESVTLVLQGQIETRDSSGNVAMLSAGDVQWSSAGAGVLRQNRIGPELARSGGLLELLTLHVNLPAQYKLTAPHSQIVTQASVPEVSLPDGAGTLRVIAGEFGGQVGPAETVTPIQLWDVRVRAGSSVTLELPSQWYGVALVLQGKTMLNFWLYPVCAHELAFLSDAGSDLALDALEDTRLIVASGAPLDEPIVAEGGLVLHTREALEQMQQVLEQGGFGTLD